MNLFEKTLDAHSTISGKSTKDILEELNNLCDISTDFSLEGRSVLGKVMRVVDGDSIKVAIPLDGTSWIFPIRISGIDCPEIRTRNDREKELGYKAKDRVEKLVLGKIISLKLGEFDKFGRILASVVTKDGVNVGDDLISSQLAVEFNGGTRHVWFP